jgi:hypothetical protein
VLPSCVLRPREPAADDRRGGVIRMRRLMVAFVAPTLEILGGESGQSVEADLRKISEPHKKGRQSLDCRP